MLGGRWWWKDPRHQIHAVFPKQKTSVLQQGCLSRGQTCWDLFPALLPLEGTSSSQTVPGGRLGQKVGYGTPPPPNSFGLVAWRPSWPLCLSTGGSSHAGATRSGWPVPCWVQTTATAPGHTMGVQARQGSAALPCLSFPYHSFGLCNRGLAWVWGEPEAPRSHGDCPCGRASLLLPMWGRGEPQGKDKVEITGCLQPGRQSWGRERLPVCKTQLHFPAALAPSPPRWCSSSVGPPPKPGCLGRRERYKHPRGHRESHGAVTPSGARGRGWLSRVWD